MCGWTREFFYIEGTGDGNKLGALISFINFLTYGLGYLFQAFNFRSMIFRNNFSFVFLCVAARDDDLRSSRDRAPRLGLRLQQLPGCHPSPYLIRVVRHLGRVHARRQGPHPGGHAARSLPRTSTMSQHKTKKLIKRDFEEYEFISARFSALWKYPIVFF